MNTQLNVQNILNNKLLEMKVKNPSFSIRALARRLEMTPAAVSEILKGQRRISRDMAVKIADKLLLDPTERSVLLKDFPEKLKRNSIHREVNAVEFNQMKLNAAQFDYISNWSNFALLSLMETSDFVSDEEWMAKRLQLSPQKVKECLERLLSLGLIQQTATGCYKRTYFRLNTTDDVASVSIKKSHLNDLDMAKEKLINIDVQNRDFCSFTLAFDPELMPEVKVMIRKMQDEVEELMRSRKCTEVYRLNTYLYPLTNLN